MSEANTARQQWAKEQAERLISEHIPGWAFRFLSGRNLQTAGQCSFKRHEATGIIWLAPWLPELNCDEMVLDTIKHEIAHAINWIKRKELGHGLGWKSECVKLKCKPERLINAPVIRPPSNYTGTCQGCGLIVQRNRLRKELLKYVCLKCGVKNGKMVWKDKFGRVVTK